MEGESGGESGGSGIEGGESEDCEVECYEYAYTESVEEWWGRKGRVAGGREPAGLYHAGTESEEVSAVVE